MTVPPSPTERLYYTDAYQTSFEARALRCIDTPPRDGAPVYAVELDRTAFYPTSGGQPFDTGRLGDARVLEVIDEDDGRVTHLVDAPIAEGATVSGTIDWPRRFEHMQQHTGQHVLSAAFDRLFSNRTESFHLGADSCSIDLAKMVTPAEVAAAVDEANRVIWEDRPVHIRFVTAEEAATLPLRKEPARGGTLRLIEVHDFDLSACGGTHVSRTGGIGIITVAAWEKFRGGVRVQFLCGSRVRRRFDEWRDALTASQRFLSVAPGELAGAIDRLQGDVKTTQRALRETREKLAVYEAAQLVARGTRTSERVAIAEIVPGLDAASLKGMAVAAAAHEGAAVVLLSDTSPALAVVAAHAAAGVNASDVLKALHARFGGKGGGKPDLAQGGGLTGEPAEIVAAARELLA